MVRKFEDDQVFGLRRPEQIAFSRPQRFVLIDSEINQTDSLIFCEHVVPITLSLPPALAKLEYTIKDITGNAELNMITLVAHGIDKIEGESSYIMDQDNMSLSIVSTGGNWYII